MEGTDICFAPVLTMKEASQHPHAKARGAYVDVSGFPQPAPAPRFSRTKESIKGPAAKRGQHTDEVLSQTRLLGQGDRRAEGGGGGGAAVGSTHDAISSPVIRGRASGGDEPQSCYGRFQIMVFPNITTEAFPLPTLPRKTGED